MDKQEIQKIRKFTTKAETNKAFSILEGIIEGITMDGVISPREIHELQQWCGSFYPYIDRYPFKEAIPKILSFLDDSILDADEIEDIKWLIKQTKENNAFYDVITSSLQQLNGIIHGIMADSIVNNSEIIELKKWLDENKEMKGLFPYDEIYSLISEVLMDNKITEDEKRMLEAYFSDFIPNDCTTLDIESFQKLKKEMNLSGICCHDPEISFDQSTFSFTGSSVKGTRDEIEKVIIEMGSEFSKNVTQKVNYLLVGQDGNPCWAFSCYGRKIEQAIELRKRGFKINIIKESDFWNSVE